LCSAGPRSVPMDHGDLGPRRIAWPRRQPASEGSGHRGWWLLIAGYCLRRWSPDGLAQYVVDGARVWGVTSKNRPTVLIAAGTRRRPACARWAPVRCPRTTAIFCHGVSLGKGASRHGADSAEPMRLPCITIASLRGDSMSQAPMRRVGHRRCRLLLGAVDTQWPPRGRGDRAGRVWGVTSKNRPTVVDCSSHHVGRLLSAGLPFGLPSSRRWVPQRLDGQRQQPARDDKTESA